MNPGEDGVEEITDEFGLRAIEGEFDLVGLGGDPEFVISPGFGEGEDGAEGGECGRMIVGSMVG